MNEQLANGDNQCIQVSGTAFKMFNSSPYSSGSEDPLQRQKL